MDTTFDLLSTNLEGIFNLQKGNTILVSQESKFALRIMVLVLDNISGIVMDAVLTRTVEEMHNILIILVIVQERFFRITFDILSNSNQDFIIDLEGDRRVERVF